MYQVIFKYQEFIPKLSFYYWQVELKKKEFTLVFHSHYSAEMKSF